MTAVMFLLLVSAVIIGVSLLAGICGRTIDDDRAQQEVANVHLQALQTAQRIHTIAWRARQAMWNEAQRSRNG